MITGAHVLIFSKDPEADRAFFRDVLKFPAVDAGEGWLIFALPPAEVAFHPANGESIRPHAGQDLAGAVLFLMCDDLSVFVPIARGPGSALRRNQPGGLGNENYSPAAKRRRDWTLSADTSDSHRPHFEVTHRRAVRS